MLPADDTLTHPTAPLPDAVPATGADGTPDATLDAANDLVLAIDELTRAQRESAARIARDLDWSRAGLGVLRLLDTCGPVPLGDVASRMRVDASVASRQVSPLVDAGLVRRTVDDEDRRVRTLELTDEGRAKVRAVYRHIGGLVARTFDDWSTDQIVEATRHIRRVAAAVVTSHEKEEQHTR